MRAYNSEADKVRDLPQVMQYITGSVIDIGCGHDKIIPDAFGVDGRKLDGVDAVTDAFYFGTLYFDVPRKFDTVFSSHFLEHIPDQHRAITSWTSLLNSGGHIVLYLPDGNYYNNRENPEHMIDMKHDEFVFWFKRCFCGEGKDFTGKQLPEIYEYIDSSLDWGQDRYSFYFIARKL